MSTKAWFTALRPVGAPLTQRQRAKLRDWYDTSGTFTIKMGALYSLVSRMIDKAVVSHLAAAADEMEAVIADGDAAEVCAPVPGEVGRQSAVDRRDDLVDDPAAWLRDYAERLREQR